MCVCISRHLEPRRARGGRGSSARLDREERRFSFVPKVSGGRAVREAKVVLLHQVTLHHLRGYQGGAHVTDSNSDSASQKQKNKALTLAHAQTILYTRN